MLLFNKWQMIERKEPALVERYTLDTVPGTLQTSPSLILNTAR